MPTDAKLEKIIELLKNLTEAGRLGWTDTPDEATFRASLESGSVRITKGRTNLFPTSGTAFITTVSPVDSYLLTILDGNGVPIEEFRPKEQKEVDALDNLYTLARRSALNTDNILDNIIQELDARKP